MGENDVTAIRQDLSDVKKHLEVLSAALNDLRVLIAGEYVRKDDFQKCQDCAEARIVALHKKLEGQTTKLLAYATFICVVIGVVFNFINK